MKLEGKIINGWYEIENNNLYTVFVTRTKNGKKIEKTVLDKPYCYAKKDFPRRFPAILKKVGCNLKKANGEFVKIEVDYPHKIKELRKELTEIGEKWYEWLWEADIPYIRRMMIDYDIKTGNTDIKLKRAFFDIECDDSEGLPNPEKHRIISIAIVDEEGKEYFIDDKDERKLLEKFVKIVSDYDILIGWNIDNFDVPYLLKRMEINKVPWRTEHFQFIDLLKFYKKFKMKTLSSYSLENVAKVELGKGKIEKEGEISKMSEEKLKKYNIMDCVLVKQLEEKLGIVDVLERITEFVGIFLSETYYNSVMVDTVILREAKKKGIILKSGSRYKKDKEKVKGAFIMQPKSGLHKGVVYLDFTSLYNRIIQTFNISPEIVIKDREDNNSKNVIIVPEGSKFRRDVDGIIPSTIRKFEELRNFYKRKRNQYKYGTEEFKKYDLLQAGVKSLLLSFYGVVGQQGNRYYNKEVAGSVTSAGRFLIKKTIEYLENKGLNVIYADTDSVVIELGERKREELIEIGKKLCKELNDYYPNLLKPFNVKENRIEMKFERIFSKLIFSGQKGYGGIKKRYAGKLIWLEGKDVDDLIIVGYEYVRGDQCQLTKELQKRVIEMLLEERTKEEIEKMLIKIKKELFAGKYDEKLILSKGITKPLEEYKTIPIHVKVAKIILKATKKPILGRVHYIITGHKKGLSAMPVLDGKIIGKPDYEYYWNNQIKPAIDRIVEGVFNEATETENKRLFEFFKKEKKAEDKKGVQNNLLSFIKK